ncbi:N-acetylmuramidase domain-containing protein [Rheinheimera sp. SA_1]|uniref:N-acetylmuramidase domain-containing protein n=1 Tax=Rheinheimera sp. SA_1 TaxID=1827365 RepID=UPI0009EE5A7B|nr:N-acetylmuramidase domain-containing protein [Rheinheimera sp. SA_1]
MSLLDEQIAFLKDTRRLLGKAEEFGFEVSGGELERSIETQSALVRTGQEKTMDNAHIRRCAIVLNFFKADQDKWRLIQSAAELEPLGNYWEELDPRNSWNGRNGNAKNFGRFERSPGAWPAKTVSLLDRPQQALPIPDAAAQADAGRSSAIILPANEQQKAKPIIRRGSTNQTAISLLQELLLQAGMLTKTDTKGEFDQHTEQAVKAFQLANGLVADGIVGEKTWVTLQQVTSAGQSGTVQKPRYLGEQDFVNAALALNLEPAIVKAVYKVESNGNGFVGDLPKILFEGHVFWERLNLIGKNPLKLAVGNETILYPKWTKVHYLGGAREHLRLNRAEAIHQDTARESASWGLFQIMGYHWKTLDYLSIDDFVTRMQQHESEQLEAFCRFIQKKKAKSGMSLRDLLEQKDWANFALYYNGTGYRQNAYDDKLREQYRKFSTLS